MTILIFTPVVLSFLLMSAHVLRAGSPPFSLIVLLVPLLLLIKRSWVAYFIMGLLVIFSLEWIRTLVNIVQLRLSMDLPWMRLCLILGVVIALTAGSAFVFLHKGIRKRYKLSRN